VVDKIVSSMSAVNTALTARLAGGRA